MPGFFIPHNNVVIPDQWCAGAGLSVSIGQLARVVYGMGNVFLSKEAKTHV